MFNSWSATKTSMTSRASTPSNRYRRDNSLVKDTLSAWKALHAYLMLSAARIGTTCTEQSRNPKSSRTAAVDRGVPPITRKGGVKKSDTLEPSLRNSGHIDTWRSGPTLRPEDD